MSDIATPAPSSQPTTSPAKIVADPLSKLDQSIKGHPNPASITGQNAAAFVDIPSIHTTLKSVRPSSTRTPTTKNILDNHPTAPPTIYLNLLILEASLRQQYKKLHLRRQKYTFFLFLLSLWTGFFFHAVYVVGPSPYSAVSTFQKLGLLGGLITFLLFWMSGLYAKTMVWPRKFVANVNKGLRVFNVKLVIVRGSLWQRAAGWMEILVVRHPLGWQYALGWKRLSSGPATNRPPAKIRRFSSSSGSSLRRSSLAGPPGQTTPGTPSLPGIPPPLSAPAAAIAQKTRSIVSSQGSNSESQLDLENLIPSRTHVKLVIMAKGFSADFREGWELYRTEYWDKENERRIKEIQAIKTSLRETNQLPPMTSSGIAMASVPSHGSQSSIPGIRGRPQRVSSLSGSAVQIGSGSLTRSRSRSRSTTPDVDESSSSSSVPVKVRPRLTKKRSGPTLHDNDSKESLTDDSSVVLERKSSHSGGSRRQR